jgi:hypothetical protein
LLAGLFLLRPLFDFLSFLLTEEIDSRQIDDFAAAPGNLSGDGQRALVLPKRIAKSSVTDSPSQGVYLCQIILFTRLGMACAS